MCHYSISNCNSCIVYFQYFDCVISQCPPFRLSYQGLGEPLCFAAFGPLATTAFYFSSSNVNIARYLWDNKFPKHQFLQYNIIKDRVYEFA